MSVGVVGGGVGGLTAARALVGVWVEGALPYLEELAAGHLAALRQVQPRRPATPHGQKTRLSGSTPCVSMSSYGCRDQPHSTC